MKASDLFQDHGTKRLSHTKFWANIGYAVMTAAFLKDAWMGGMDAEKMIAYGVIVAGAASVSKFLSLRYGSMIASAQQYEVSENGERVDR